MKKLIAGGILGVIVIIVFAGFKVTLSNVSAANDEGQRRFLPGRSSSNGSHDFGERRIVYSSDSNLRRMGNRGSNANDNSNENTNSNSNENQNTNDNENRNINTNRNDNTTVVNNNNSVVVNNYQRTIRSFSGYGGERQLVYVSNDPIPTGSSNPNDPKRPSNLTAHVAGNTVELSWRDNSNNESSFWIRRTSTAAGDTDGDGDFIAKVGANTTHFTDRTAKPGRTYYYRIRANKIDGSSHSWSNFAVVRGSNFSGGHDW